jgi:methylmalonyl-CoA mutase N-terminal domain/subunit
MSERPDWPTRREAWDRTRLDPALRRSPERRVRFATISDVEVERLYGPWSWSRTADGAPAGGGGPTAVDHHGDLLRRGEGRWAEFDDVRDIGLPGEPPFTRGIHPLGYRARLWTMRMFAGFGAAEDTNARFRQLLDAGQTGLSIAYDMPTLYGYDTDDPEADGEFGTCGVAVSSLADMEVLLAGLPLDRVSTSMTINSPAAAIWAMYIVAAEKAGVPRAALEGTTQNDILKEFVAQKEFLFPPEPSMRLVTDTIEFGTRELPRWNTISISGYHIREAGSTAVQELAFTIADGMAYVEAALARGMRVDDFAPRLSFFFNSHSDFFEEIAKFRASRRIWYKLMTERYRAENERSTWMRFHTQTAGVSLAPQQPLNNLTRVALQALAAVLGGTQSLHTDAYDEALAVPTAEAALLALRQQQIIAEESGVASTVDPLGGSWFVESLTNETERAVWRYLDEIDRRGGMVKAITEGYPQREIADAAYRFQRELDGGERRIVGVNAYVDEAEETTVPVLEVPAGSLERQLQRLARVRRERDPSAVESALRGLREAARRPGTSETNLMPHFVNCAEAYATLGEQCQVLREVFGEYREPAAV